LVAARRGDAVRCLAFAAVFARAARRGAVLCFLSAIVSSRGWRDRAWVSFTVPWGELKQCISLSAAMQFYVERGVN